MTHNESDPQEDSDGRHPGHLTRTTSIEAFAAAARRHAERGTWDDE